jgi:hypothetical protein
MSRRLLGICAFRGRLVASDNSQSFHSGSEAVPRHFGNFVFRSERVIARARERNFGPPSRWAAGGGRPIQLGDRFEPARRLFSGSERVRRPVGLARTSIRHT